VSATGPLAYSVLGAPARLAAPEALWLLLAVAALAALGTVQLLRRRALLGRTAGAQARRLAPRANLARPAGRLGLSVTGLALLALALSRPQCGSRTELTRRLGVDVAVVLDVSSSMLARDVAPDRLTRAKLEVGALLEQLGGDRVGLVVFAADAFVQCPLTSDAAAARLFLRAVSPRSVPRQGSDLGQALRAARAMLESSEGAGRTKVVLLVSDGEDLEGTGPAVAKTLGEEGVRLFALAVGTPAGEVIPVLDEAGAVKGYKKDGKGEPVLTRLDLATLRQVADAGGGEVFELDSPDRGPAAIRPALDALEKGELTSRLTVRYEDRYALAAFPGLLCLLAALLLGEAGRPRAAGDDDDREAAA